MRKTDSYGAIKVLNRWFDLLPQILKQWRVFICYGAVYTVLSLVLNRWTYACQGRLNGYWCHWYDGNAILFIVTTVLFFIAAIYLLAAFSDDFYKGMLKEREFHCKDIFIISKTRLKSIGMFWLMWSTVIVSAAFFTYILNKQANPDWRVEFLWFILVFCSFVNTLLMLRCFAGLAYYFNESHIPFKDIFKLTEGRSYVGIFSFLILILFCSNINLSVMRYFAHLLAQHNYLLTAVVSDFGDNIIKLVYVALFLILSQAEYLQIKEKQTQQTTVEPTAPVAEDIIPEPELPVSAKSTTKKAAKKKKTQRKNKNRAKKD